MNGTTFGHSYTRQETTAYSYLISMTGSFESFHNGLEVMFPPKEDIAPVAEVVKMIGEAVPISVRLCVCLCVCVCVCVCMCACVCVHQ